MASASIEDLPGPLGSGEAKGFRMFQGSRVFNFRALGFRDV